MIINQAQLFLIFLVNGVIIGLFFDFFRILRKSFKTKDFMTYFEDFIFWILTGAIILYTIFKFNNGEIRFYMFIAIAVGVVLYMILFSSYFIKINMFIINIFKKIIKKIFIISNIPVKALIKILRNIFLKPTSFIIINIRKIFTNLYQKIIKKIKKIETKEGIWKVM